MKIFWNLQKINPFISTLNDWPAISKEKKRYVVELNSTYYVHFEAFKYLK